MTTNANIPVADVETMNFDGVTVISEMSLILAIFGSMSAFCLWLEQTPDSYWRCSRLFKEFLVYNAIEDDCSFYCAEKHDFSNQSAANQAIREGNSYVITENIS